MSGEYSGKNNDHSDLVKNRFVVLMRVTEAGNTRSNTHSNHRTLTPFKRETKPKNKGKNTNSGPIKYEFERENKTNKTIKYSHPIQLLQGGDTTSNLVFKAT